MAQYAGFDLIQATNAYINAFWGTNTVVFSYSRVLPRYQTNALGELAQSTYDSQSRVTSTTTPAGLISTNICFTGGTYPGFLDRSIDFAASGTNTTYYRTNALPTRPTAWSIRKPILAGCWSPIHGTIFCD